MRRQLTVAIACVCMTATLAAGALAEPRTNLPPSDYQAKIDKYRKETWRWQRLMGVSRTVRLPAPRPPLDKRVPLWRKRATVAYKQAQRPPHRAAWLCIHRYEGAWNDPNPPYYGGLQMDWSFMRTYGSELLRRKGTADNWTPLEQMWVAERAYRSGRGFYPWPNTARYCGLI